MLLLGCYLVLLRRLNNLIVSIQYWILVWPFIVLHLEAYQNRNTRSTLHWLAARRDDAYHVAPLIGWEIEALRYLVIVLDQLLTDDRLLFVFGLAGPEGTGDLRDLLEELRFDSKVVLFDISHLFENQMLQFCCFLVEALLDGQWDFSMWFGALQFLLLDAAEPDDVVCKAWQLERLPHEELLDL